MRSRTLLGGRLGTIIGASFGALIYGLVKGVEMKTMRTFPELLPSLGAGFEALAPRPIFSFRFLEALRL